MSLLEKVSEKFTGSLFDNASVPNSPSYHKNVKNITLDDLKSINESLKKARFTKWFKNKYAENYTHFSTIVTEVDKITNHLNVTSLDYNSEKLKKQILVKNNEHPINSAWYETIDELQIILSVTDNVTENSLKQCIPTPIKTLIVNFLHNDLTNIQHDLIITPQAKTSLEKGCLDLTNKVLAEAKQPNINYNGVDTLLKKIQGQKTEENLKTHKKLGQVSSLLTWISYCQKTTTIRLSDLNFKCFGEDQNLLVLAQDFYDNENFLIAFNRLLKNNNASYTALRDAVKQFLPTIVQKKSNSLLYKNLKALSHIYTFKTLNGVTDEEIISWAESGLRNSNTSDNAKRVYNKISLTYCASILKKLVTEKKNFDIQTKTEIQNFGDYLQCLVMLDKYCKDIHGAYDEFIKGIRHFDTVNNRGKFSKLFDRRKPNSPNDKYVSIDFALKQLNDLIKSFKARVHVSYNNVLTPLTNYTKNSNNIQYVLGNNKEWVSLLKDFRNDKLTELGNDYTEVIPLEGEIEL